MAIIGAGISGLVVAHLLRDSHRVTIFDGNSYAGGHTNTVRIDEGDRTVAVDTGFVVFNEVNYPNFCRLLAELEVDSQPSDMSFSVRSDRGGFEYSGNSLAGLFADRRNLWRWSFHRQLLDLARFRRDVADPSRAPDESETLGAFMERRRYSRAFVERLIVPMGSALWSTVSDRVRDFPAARFLHFFRHHQLLERAPAPVWRVIRGGAASYVERILAPLRNQMRLQTPVRGIERRADGVWVSTDECGSERFDHCVVATHADQALRMLVDPTDAEQQILSAFPFQANRTVLHSDRSLLPRRQAAWSSWNYHLPVGDESSCRVTYWMNRLQTLESERNYCVSLNASEAIAPERTIATFDYEHPMFSVQSFAAQREHRRLIGVNRTSYCGAYWGYGFHEDGVVSALAVAEHFGRTLA